MSFIKVPPLKRLSPCVFYRGIASFFFFYLTVQATVCNPSTSKGRKQQVEILSSNATHIAVVKVLSFDSKSRQHELELLEVLKGPSPHRKITLEPAEYTEWEKSEPELLQLQKEGIYLLFLKQNTHWDLVLPGLADNCPEQGSPFLPRGGMKLDRLDNLRKTETFRFLRELKIVLK